jgi:hypothetical protein
VISNNSSKNSSRTISPPPPPAPPELTGILPYDSKEFGLTQDEYEILLEDIEQAIEEGNSVYGYGGNGYLGEDGNYYPFPDNDKPKRIPKSRRKSVEQIAIAKGLIKIHEPNQNEERKRELDN